MNQWYRKPGVKAIVFLVGCLCGSALITSLSALITMAGTADPYAIIKMAGTEYEESDDFNHMAEDTMVEVLNQIWIKQLLETDGAYNPNKLVDVMEYAKNRQITGDNISGVSYTLEQIANWSEDFVNGSSEFYDDNSVIVCEKTDGSYYYYYLSDFLEKFEQGNFRMIFEDSYQTQSEFLEKLASGTYTTSGGYRFRISDSQGTVLYTDCWNFGKSLREKYAPAGADNLLDVINATPKLNGKLSILYDDIAFTLNEINGYLASYTTGWTYLEEGNTNLSYIYIREDTHRIVTNRSEYSEYEKTRDNVLDMTSEKNVKYMIISPRLKDFKTNMSISQSNEWDIVRSFDPDKKSDVTLVIAIDTSYPIQDQFYEGHNMYNKNLPMLKYVIAFGIFGGVFFVISVVWLTITAGKQEGSERIRTSAFDRWRTEASAVFILLAVFLITELFRKAWEKLDLSAPAKYPGYEVGGDIAYNTVNLFGRDYVNVITGTSISVVNLIILFGYSILITGCLLAGYLSFVKRVRTKTVWRNSLTRSALSFVKRIFKEKLLSGWSLALMVVFILIQWAAILFQSGIMIFLAAAADIIALYMMICGISVRRRLRRGIKEISSGNIGYKIPVKGLAKTERDLAEQINGIGNGLTRALEEATKNERLKTDLITNVSHDIKTPLTSIINYVDILKRSDIQDEKIQGYLDILESKAQRLKTLTEDLVEVSKVSSGNIVLEYMDVNLVELIHQTEGEMVEKFAARNLVTVLNLPEEPAVIHADGRQMWRVLENIFNNAAKYAMPGTRVYADLYQDEEKVEFSLKNVSEQQLNISADELTERFIRGDISRSTEGSGLGLSIAKSLVTMQGGTFDLYLDGDLFRVNIGFPRVKKEQEFQ